MATEPGKGSRPTFVSADNENIIVDLNLNTENRGSDITSHELAVSTDGLTYTTLISYDGTSSSYTLNQLIDGLTSGQIYRIRLRALNAIGAGEWSSDLLAAMTAPPIAPAMPVKDVALSTKTSIAFDWVSSSDNPGADGGRVLGYRVYKAKDLAGSDVLVYDAKELRTLTSYVVDDLTTGTFYRFKVSAYNFNGEGEMSDALET